ncbi:hypothetical protein CC78DRAFT_621310 [Lojkania enalia]|uniref:Uncharacterized protein n=1 Tax=Lojkania enalia TaxID=147567 RepID=A0A9P4K1P7_9PLEO|nr:hypothetical protein CC78DRAFT_621310 [Didymosphaeria enalia]
MPRTAALTRLSPRTAQGCLTDVPVYSSSPFQNNTQPPFTPDSLPPDDIICHSCKSGRRSNMTSPDVHYPFPPKQSSKGSTLSKRLKKRTKPKQENPNQENPNHENPNHENPNHENPNHENPDHENPYQENPKSASIATGTLSMDSEKTK